MTLKEKIDLLMLKYEDVREKEYFMRHFDNLANRVNYSCEFDETFDLFYDNKELRLKYNAWDIEQDCIDFDVTNTDLRSLLDEEDQTKLAEFIENRIGYMQDHIEDMKREEKLQEFVNN
jgi:hypothetical protein